MEQRLQDFPDAQIIDIFLFKSKTRGKDANLHLILKSTYRCFALFKILFSECRSCLSKKSHLINKPCFFPPVQISLMGTSPFAHRYSHSGHKRWYPCQSTPQICILYRKRRRRKKDRRGEEEEELKKGIKKHRNVRKKNIDIFRDRMSLNRLTA